jgi:hypothetical protein
VGRFLRRTGKPRRTAPDGLPLRYDSFCGPLAAVKGKPYLEAMSQILSLQDAMEQGNGQYARKRARESEARERAAIQRVKAVEEGMVRFAMHTNAIIAVTMARLGGPLSIPLDELQAGAADALRVRQRPMTDESGAEGLLVFLCSPEEAAADLRREEAAQGRPADRRTPDEAATTEAIEPGQPPGEAAGPDGHTGEAS